VVWLFRLAAWPVNPVLSSGPPFRIQKQEELLRQERFEQLSNLRSIAPQTAM
jgi:hypothetical protein